MPPHLGFRIEEQKLELYLLAHELYTGSRIARYRGIEYYQRLESWIYVCSNFQDCRFRLRVRKYADDPGFVSLQLLRPHTHTQIKTDKKRHYPCAVSRCVTQLRGHPADEVSHRLDEFVKQALAMEDLIGKLHRLKYKSHALGRISGYVYEELIPSDLLIQHRMQRFQRNENQFNEAAQSTPGYYSGAFYDADLGSDGAETDAVVHRSDLSD